MSLEIRLRVAQKELAGGIRETLSKAWTPVPFHKELHVLSFPSLSTPANVGRFSQSYRMGVNRTKLVDSCESRQFQHNPSPFFMLNYRYLSMYRDD